MDPSTITPELIQQLIQTQQQQQAEIQALQVQNGQLPQQNQQLHQELINHQQTVVTAQQGTAGNSPPAAVKSNLKPKEPFTYTGSRKQLPDWLCTTERWLHLSHMGVGSPLMQPQSPVVPSGVAPSPMQHQQMWQPATRPVTDFLPGLWGSQRQNQNAGMQNGYPFHRYYSTKTSRAPGELIRFHGRLAGVPVRCLYDPGADLNFLAHSVAESNRFTLWDLDEPTAYKGGLNGGPQLPISQEVKGLPLCIQGFSAPLDLTVVDLDDDYDVVLGMPFCEEYIPLPHYCEKALTIPARESLTGRDLLLLDSEEYPTEGEGEDFFSQRELRRLMKRPSSRVHLFRLEAVRKGGVSDTLGVHSLQSAGKSGDPPPLSSFPPDHPINSSTYTGFRKHLQSKEVPPSVRPVLEKHFDRFPDELPGLPPY
uniref:Uncharacterized protein n=1 Tax=Chromera velia CCMP2878 TaxID=1169474 RepID=A0A0G4GLC7_9ALVE|eukprot:Cvel_696.t1-p1 / transcript=Cvel_696.t1 / gene=Cvel_696 / organism=Chromera_velia_CCMP2878 / gene_product=hypothetical protein / transcript_product=hypothetical protein / location=Cvel_scaffold21:142038-143980(-) / protein_length=422 / sequence_SO=supercontig / SO=protein_coding / is_pseudo=false